MRKFLIRFCNFRARTKSAFELGKERAEFVCACDVVSVHVSVDSVDEIQVEISDDFCVASCSDVNRILMVLGADFGG